MAMGAGLSSLMQSPDLGGGLKSAVEQFTEWLRQRGTGASMDRPAIQAPVGTPPRERAGGLRTAAGEGAATFMQQAGETAAEPWKPQALDIALIAASVAGPIIAALQPEGRGRRGQRKQQRMSNLFEGLGELAQKGVGLRMGSFEAGKEATFGAAEKRAEMSVEEAEAQYGRTIGGVEAAESKRRWGEEFGLAERGMAVRERPKAEKPEKPDYTPMQTRTIQLQEDKKRQENILVEANQITRPLFGTEFVINSVEELDEAIYTLTKRFPKTGYAPGDMPGSGYGIVQQLKQLRDQYYGEGTPMLPMGGGQTGLGMGEAPLTPEEQAELEARRRR